MVLIVLKVTYQGVKVGSSCPAIEVQTVGKGAIYQHPVDFIKGSLDEKLPSYEVLKMLRE